MALGWLDHLARGKAIGLSGGSEPADEVNPTAVAAMAEVGIDIGTTAPRRWTDDDLSEAGVVITMGCGDACPFVPGKRYEDWPVDDPAGQPLDAVRAIRDDIKARVEVLLQGLG
jgi:protein-tyrosine-phosphatase